jgi:hypothetical protein
MTAFAYRIGSVSRRGKPRPYTKPSYDSLRLRCP